MNNCIKDVIKDKRIQGNMTQEELAAKLFVTRQSASNWERGKSLPEVEKLRDLAELFDISVDSMLMDDIGVRNKLIGKYRVAVLIVSVILISILSVIIYNNVFPPHLAVISGSKGECDNTVVTVTKSQIEQLPDSIFLLVHSREEVSYKFGTYCISSNMHIRIDNEDYDSPNFSVQILGPGFVSAHEQMSFRPVGQNLYIFLHHGVSVKERTAMGIYNYGGNSSFEFKIPLALEYDETYVTEAKFHIYDVQVY